MPSIRPGFVLIAAALCAGGGCTHLGLERRAVNQAGTLSDLQYRQVLDNLAAFAANPDALPWHLKLASGTIQVTDQGSSELEQTLISSKPTIFVPTISGSRAVVNQWNGVPTVSPEHLTNLHLAYRIALDPFDARGTLRSEIYQRICDLAVHNNIVLSREVLKKAINYSRLDEVKRAQLLKKVDELHEQLDTTFDQLARLGRPITDAQVDNYAARLASKITEDTRGEARARLAIMQEQQRVAVSQTRIGAEDEIVRLTRAVLSLPYVPRYPVTGRAEHNPHEIELTQIMIRGFIQLAEDPRFAQPWVSVATKCGEKSYGACFVGRYHKCGRHAKVWVAPQDLATLRDFTLIVLALAPIEGQESAPSFPSGGITYSPSISSGR